MLCLTAFLTAHRCWSSKPRNIQGEMRSMVGNIKGQPASVVAGLSLALILGTLEACQGLPKNVANCPTTPTAPANTSIVPPAPEPPAAALCGFPLSITSPANGASVNSPVPILAIAIPPDPIYTVRLYVDGFAVLYSPQYDAQPTDLDAEWATHRRNRGGRYGGVSGHDIDASKCDRSGARSAEPPRSSGLGLMFSCDCWLDLCGGIGRRYLESVTASNDSIIGRIGGKVQPRWEPRLFERTLLDANRRGRQRQPLHL